MVTGLGIQGMGNIPAEFRQTMKHNSSNSSISGKKFINLPANAAVPAGNSNIKKHQSDMASVGGVSKKNYMSPYS
jgi:hypothetical protein